MMRYLAIILLCLVIAATASCAIVQKESSDSEKPYFSDTLLNNKIENYRQLYPDLTFLVLQGGDDLLNDMMTLDLVLGDLPMSLDYEHPSDLREDLMDVSIERILLMLQTNMPSSSLFKTDTSLGWQKNVCVLTINPDKLASDSIQATKHLLNLPRGVIEKIPKDLQLSPDDYLAFIIDHEVYHCLKSIYVGPQLMSHKKAWGDYNIFLNEQGADAYSLGMHIKNRSEVSPFVKNVLRIRRMSIYNADPNHLTCKAINQVLKIPAEDITAMNENEVFNMANNIRDDMDTGYSGYMNYLASAVQAMKEIGVDDAVSEKLHTNCKGIQADIIQVENLVEHTRRCISELLGAQVVP